MTSGRQTWPGLATEFRALRESLLSIHSQDAALNLLTHELAAEVCLRAADYAEFLKTVQNLVQTAFPAAVVHPQVEHGILILLT